METYSDEWGEGNGRLYFSVTETCNGASTLLQNHFARDKSFKIVTASIRKSYYKGR